MVGNASAKTLWPVCLTVSSHTIKEQKGRSKVKGTIGGNALEETAKS